jgi:hypothetical protein
MTIKDFANNSIVLIYDPRIKLFFGDIHKAIFIRQLIFYFKANNWQPFFRHIYPSSEGGVSVSLMTELGFSEHEMKKCIKIGLRIYGDNFDTLEYNNLFCYWVENGRTWFAPNMQELDKFADLLCHKTHTQNWGNW